MDVGITFGKIEPITISINKEHFRKEFEKVFTEWESRLWVGMTPEDQKELLNELLHTMQAEGVEPSDKRKWRYECYICGARSKGEGKLVKSCDCKHGPPIKLYRP